MSENPLAELPVLPKLHAHWPIPEERLNVEDLVTQDFIRVTGAVSVHGRDVTAKQFGDALELANDVFDKHLVEVTLCILMRPYHGFTVSEEELEYVAGRLEPMRWALEAAFYKPPVIFLLDSEKLEAGPETFAHYKAYADLLRKFFPEARQEWYGRGIQRNSEAETGWDWMPHHGLGDYAVGYSCRLYALPNWRQMEETFTRTAALGAGPVIPWVALGAGYQTLEKKLGRKWTSPWDYHRVDSWQAGWQMNNHWFGDRPEKFGPWNRADIIILYPNPLARDVTLAHFIEYVRGATH